MPLRRLLVSLCGGEDGGLREMRAADLKSDRKAGGGEAAWNGNRGQAVDIKRCRIVQ